MFPKLENPPAKLTWHHFQQLITVNGCQVEKTIYLRSLGTESPRTGFRKDVQCGAPLITRLSVNQWYEETVNGALQIGEHVDLTRLAVVLSASRVSKKQTMNLLLFGPINVAFMPPKLVATILGDWLVPNHYSSITCLLVTSLSHDRSPTVILGFIEAAFWFLLSASWRQRDHLPAIWLEARMHWVVRRHVNCRDVHLSNYDAALDPYQGSMYQLVRRWD